MLSREKITSEKNKREVEKAVHEARGEPQPRKRQLSGRRKLRGSRASLETAFPYQAQECNLDFFGGQFLDVLIVISEIEALYQLKE